MTLLAKNLSEFEKKIRDDILRGLQVPSEMFNEIENSTARVVTEMERFQKKVSELRERLISAWLPENMAVIFRISYLRRIAALKTMSRKRRRKTKRIWRKHGKI